MKCPSCNSKLEKAEVNIEYAKTTATIVKDADISSFAP